MDNPIRSKHGRVLNGSLVVFAILGTCVAIVLALGGESYIRLPVKGANLRAKVSGGGEPVIVFEAGAGGPLESWIKVQPAVSVFARTFSYDRAGNGLSTKSSSPREGRNIAAELHAALEKAGLLPPYILVGHSLGGPYIRVFAGLYPNEIAGLVLVDPTQEDLIAWAEARDPKSRHANRNRPDNEIDCAPATFVQANESPLPNVPIFLISGQGPKVIPSFVSGDFQQELLKDQSESYPAKLAFYQQWLQPSKTLVP
ncbi:MAG: haloalkane dehalogenase [Verrucomicrobia bacterium]|nr:haloalkane dehalogenase [Verrucomicrobiota bacterium]